MASLSVSFLRRRLRNATRLEVLGLGERLKLGSNAERDAHVIDQLGDIGGDEDIYAGCGRRKCYSCKVHRS